MKYLLLIGNGSRKQSANDEIERLAERLATLAGNDFGGVLQGRNSHR